MRTHYNANEINYIRNNYPTLGASLCATHLNKTPKQIRIKAQKLGIKLNTDTRSNIIKNCKSLHIKDFKDYSVNPNIFINCDTAESAYILGFLWADGYLYITPRQRTIGMNIEMTDFDEYIRPILDKLGRWNMSKYTPKLNKGKPQIVARISNKPLAIYLSSKNYNDKSQCALSIIDTIPLNLQKYWYRGVFDGDGCVYMGKKQRQVTITGPYEQNWDYMEKLLKENNIIFNIKREIVNTGKRSRIRIDQTESMLKFLSFIYDQYETDNIGYRRKFEKFQEILKIYRPKSSKFKGVSRLKNGKFQVKYTGKKGCYKFLGTFETEESARNTYNEYIKTIIY